MNTKNVAKRANHKQQQLMQTTNGKKHCIPLRMALPLLH